MHVKSIQLKDFRGFHHLEISGLTKETRLVVLTGPNGAGKSSVLEAFNEWTKERGRGGMHDLDYFSRKGSTLYEPRQNVVVDFWEYATDLNQYAPSGEDFTKAVYVRSAYRNDPDFSLREIWHQGQEYDLPNVERLIENDVRVAKNYNRLVARTMTLLYDNQDLNQSKRDLIDQLVGPLCEAIKRVFSDLVFEGTGNPTVDGTFLFSKGSIDRFPYKNLSGGEKAAFDLLLDLHLAYGTYKDSIYCIDEPEAHMGTRTQAALLDELYRQIPNTSQLWIATHSIGMVRKAADIERTNPGSVVFLDFTNRDLDRSIILEPAVTNRQFWNGVFSQSLDDLAELIAPKTIVLCEGETTIGPDGFESKGFDSKCYSAIFADKYPDVSFISVGNSREVSNDRLNLAQAVELIHTGSEVVKLVDRDEMNEEDIRSLPVGTRVLGRRHLESYLLDLELFQLLCRKLGMEEKYAAIVQAYSEEFAALPSRNKLNDDAKSAAPSFVAKVKNILSITQGGQKYSSFLLGFIVPLVIPSTNVYQELERDIFVEV